MREIKFRAWLKKTVDHYISEPIRIANEEYRESEPVNKETIAWDTWYDNRKDRERQIRLTMDIEDVNRYEISYFMSDEISVRGDGRTTVPYGCQIINLMQYTGLKDIDGVEIYEGDIVEYITYFNSAVKGYKVRELVVFGLGKWSLRGRGRNQLGGYALVPLFGVYNHCNVIGNIHESSELLEEGE